MRLYCILGLASALALSPAQAQLALANGIFAIVNDVVITYKDVESSIGPAVELLARQYAGQPELLQQKITALQRERIEELVARQLILHDFTNAGYNLPESIIEDNVQGRIRQDYGDRLTLMKTLQSQGITYESFRRNIRENIIISALREKHVSQVLIISPNKIEAYYQTNLARFKVDEQVKLRMIVLSKTSDSTATVTNLAHEILLKLEGGTPFAEMASVYSDGSQRAQGGDWGWADRSMLRTNLAEIAFSLQPGQRSGVIQTPEACFIMLVEDRRPAHTKPLAEVREEIERNLIAQENERLQKKWIDRLKAKSFVRYF
jgi:parvulin-like peptidyl-prolyl isomerase